MTTTIFPDSGLHLAVFNALIDEGALTEEVVSEVINEIDPDLDDMDRIHEAIRRLHAHGLPSDAVGALEALDFTGVTIYLAIENALDVYTGGEEDCYQLMSLEGIGALRSLKRLDLDGFGYREDKLDLRPLENHPALSSLYLSGECTSAASLEKLPNLTMLEGGATFDDPTVLDRLRSRGVNVCTRGDVY